MSTFILVHGAWSGAWCWKKVIPLLDSAGHTVIAPDLPGHGDNRTSSKISLRLYVDYLCELVRDCDEQVILAGHSMGGMIISQAAEYLPERISCLVYIAAFLPGDGESIRDIEMKFSGSLVAPNLVYSANRRFVTLPDEIIRDAFYGDCSEADFRFAASLLQQQPVLPFITRTRLTDHHYGKTRKIYLECLQDRAIPVEGQRLMHGRTACDQIYTLDAAHSPFLSVPGKLANILLRL